MTQIQYAVSRIEPIAAAYGEIVSGEETDSIATDIIADALHWCAANGGNVRLALRLGEMHYLEEEGLEAGEREEDVGAEQVEALPEELSADVALSLRALYSAIW